jgi:hypothetical protein
MLTARRRRPLVGTFHPGQAHMPTPSKGVVRRRPPGTGGGAPPRPMGPNTKGQFRPPPPAQPVGPPPQTVEGTGIRANANQSWSDAQSGYRDAVWRAAMGLGDQSVFSKLQADPTFAGYKFSVDPNSQYATLGRQETQGLNDVDETQNQGNTFFSGMRLKGRQDLSDDIQRQRLAATTSYEDQLRQYAQALSAARGDYGLALSQADQADIDAALAQDPQPAGPMPGPAPPRPKKKKSKKKGHHRG